MIQSIISIVIVIDAVISYYFIETNNKNNF